MKYGLLMNAFGGGNQAQDVAYVLQNARDGPDPLLLLGLFVVQQKGGKPPNEKRNVYLLFKNLQ